MSVSRPLPHRIAALRSCCMVSVLLLSLGSATLGCAADAGPQNPAASAPAPFGGPTETAIFAGGCFWCTESDFEKVPGVVSAVSGYIGGEDPNPTYEEVSAGRTGHTEAVRIEFDPSRVTYAALVKKFWTTIDPTTEDRQFCDWGTQYRTGIFYLDEAQREAALASKAEVEATKTFPEPLVTEITAAGTFHEAEAYHQDFYKKKSAHYKRYRTGCGRDARLEELWGERAHEPVETLDGAGSGEGNAAYRKPSDAELRQRLTPEQYRVTQEDGTERSFQNAYWDHKKAGIYVDIVSGEPLFSSTDKFKSGTGWPSFTRPLVAQHIVELEDRSYGMVRTEVRSKYADSHLGHLFNDGPPPTGQRYCINSAALRFVPVEDLEREGLGEYLRLFETAE